MADDYTFKDASGTSKTARADELTSGALLPFVGVATSIPTVTGFQNYAITASMTLTSVPSNSTHALITVDLGGGNIRFRDDGVNPTTAVGLLIQAGGAAELTNLSSIRMISTSATTSINVSFRRYDQ